MAVGSEQELLNWIDKFAKPFFEKYAPEKMEAILSDYNRLNRILSRSDQVTVCFLGNSGVGKSTLLNALAAGDQQVLPAGGIGPLTAQATEVSFSEIHKFRVTYHPKEKLWQTVFAIESRIKRQAKLLKQNSNVDSLNNYVNDNEEIVEEIILSEDEKNEALNDATSNEKKSDEGLISDTLEGYIKQAKNIVCGNQFSEQTLEYLVDALRISCSLKTKWGKMPVGDDIQRIDRVKKILDLNKGERFYERSSNGDHRAFMEDLKAHAAGYLSPLIERIEVGWPADVLKAGVKLVDLPGVGIAQDSYRDVTKSYVREKARAVIIVVDRAGPTESTVDLLRTSGYWDRLVGAADDPSSDPCSMLIAVTKVDDVMQEEWANLVANLADGLPRPKKREVFSKLVADFKPRMLTQISQQLESIGESNNSSVTAARLQARKSILETLQIHPVSAPEMRRLLIDDEEDKSFLSDIDQSGVPQLQQSLIDLAKEEQVKKQNQLLEVSNRLKVSVLTDLQMVKVAWNADTRATEEAERLSVALDVFLSEKKEEYRARAAGFREYLKETVQVMIEALVHEARAEAEIEVQRYLRSLNSAHWGTLRAAVRRGGTFYGSRHINLPDDITGFFQEPMAAVWGQKLLTNIRKRTSDLAEDIEQMVNELCEWAVANDAKSVNRKLLESQQLKIKGLAAQMKAVGKEAVDEMRETVKTELSKTIRDPIKEACQKFVKRGDDQGPGVKYRILELFNQLANDATTAAREPAIRILKANATKVRADIQKQFKDGGDPLQDTANVIVERHEDRLRRSDAQKRKQVLQDVDLAIDNCPQSISATASI